MPVVGSPSQSPGPSGIYANHQDLIDEIGPKNLDKLRDLDNSKNQANMDSVEQKAINLSDDLINSMFQLAGYSLPLTALPGYTLPMSLIRVAAAKFSHWQLYNLKGKRDNDQEGTHMEEKYKWAMEQIKYLIDAGLPAVLLPTDEGGSGAQRGVIRTIKINQGRYTTPPTDEFAYP